LPTFLPQPVTEVSAVPAATDPSNGLLHRAAVVSSDLLDDVDAKTRDVDGDAGFDGRTSLRSLAIEGALDLGLPGSAGTYSDQARVLADLAAVCMTTAFSAWAHRMTAEYLVVHGGTVLADLANEVRTARRPGSTALAGTFRAAAGVADMPVRLESGRADGFISWASNLYDDAVVVTGVGGSGGHRLMAFDLGSPGAEVRPVTGLLALDASHSGSVGLDGLAVDDGRILERPFEEFIAAVRPTFLVLQSAFALGLASASLASIGDLNGIAAVMQPQVDGARAELARLAGHLDQATHQLDDGGRPSMRPSLQLRLDAAHLAVSATQLELAVRGGGAYAATSSTARRVREALFLPVQSPTEVQLQWELQQIS
jgi:alkylation response protein AidB-like acyl-CoA dehydrogenase